MDLGIAPMKECQNVINMTYKLYWGLFGGGQLWWKDEIRKLFWHFDATVDEVLRIVGKKRRQYCRHSESFFFENNQSVRQPAQRHIFDCRHIKFRTPCEFEF